MARSPLASIIISNYNYGRFLGGAIESALGQTYLHTEVIVVDDGSTDNSREVLAGFGGRVQAVLKENGGQASAFNRGFRRSRGEVIVLLDADDLLLPTALEKAVGLFAGGGVAKVHWPLWVLDAQGRRTSEVFPDQPLADGDVREALLRGGADGYHWPPTSGNCWSRTFLEKVVPLPEEGTKVWPDFYLATLAPLYGLVRRVPEPQGLYRIHGTNYTWSVAVERRLEELRYQLDRSLGALSSHCRALGLRPDVKRCREKSWYAWLRHIHLATRDLAAVMPPGARYLLADEDTWATRDLPLPGRPVPFPEPPDGDESALLELERLRQAGADFLVFGSPAFWWLDYYAGLGRHLRATYPCLIETERVIVFDLRRW
jgi:glycosyltransferase involved in cell wall biosynthesis